MALGSQNLEINMWYGETNLKPNCQDNDFSDLDKKCFGLMLEIISLIDLKPCIIIIQISYYIILDAI